MANRKTTNTATAIADSNFVISSISPPTGDVSALPTTIVITFNQNYLRTSTATVISHYNLTCGGNVFAASSVNYVYGANHVTVTMPAVGALSAGTTCYFSISPNVANEAGYPIVGSRSAAYLLTNNVALTAAGATAAVGALGGPAFSETAGTTLGILSGINLRVGAHVSALQGQWQENFQAGGSVINGAVHGDGLAALNVNFSCPNGMRITGLRGRAGAYVNALGIVCQDRDQAAYWESSLAGGSAGGAFSVNCPAGTFADGISGRSGSNLNQIALLCR
ncbi:MAG: hypothetical protein EOP11_01135 [Proteobacteria bacterium]|nr:MAG: hypothetical protein EOP11_01135 [Pseudomonadota bacterium]